MSATRARVLLPIIAAVSATALVLSHSAPPAYAEDGGWGWLTGYRISVVWPHDGRGSPAPAEQSRAVNVSVWPGFEISCTEKPDLSLWMAKDNEPLGLLPIEGRLARRTIGETSFVTLEFEDVPADLAGEPSARYSFFARDASNVWVHAADPRTYLPEPVLPTGFSGARPLDLDARIQVVWPHDAEGRFAPVDEAVLVNVAVDLFEHGSLNSVPVEYRPSSLKLVVAQGNEPPSAVIEWPPPEKVVYSANGQVYPRWVFNDVPVEPGERYHFMVSVLPVGSRLPTLYTSVWTHAADARTFLPEPEVPPSCVP